MAWTDIDITGSQVTGLEPYDLATPAPATTTAIKAAARDLMRTLVLSRDGDLLTGYASEDALFDAIQAITQVQPMLVRMMLYAVLHLHYSGTFASANNTDHVKAQKYFDMANNEALGLHKALPSLLVVGTDIIKKRTDSVVVGRATVWR